VAVNLRSNPYWWSTRLYLLAALADEYTNIERFIFVEQDAARIYVGMATPSDVRKGLGRRLPYLESIFRDTQRNARLGSPNIEQEVSNIGFQWPSQQFEVESPVSAGQCSQCHAVKYDRKLLPEKEVRQLMKASDIREWFGNVLETEFRDWRGNRATLKLYTRIMTCNASYVPLLHDSHLEKVVNRHDLAKRLAETYLGSTAS